MFEFPYDVVKVANDMVIGGATKKELEELATAPTGHKETDDE